MAKTKKYDEQQLEQQHLQDIIQQIKQAKNKLTHSISHAKADIDDINRTFNDDVHISLGDDSVSIAAALSIHQQQQMLAERNNAWQRSQQQLGILEKLEKNPYFARIDFRELPSGKPETIYIGLASFTDQQNHFLIYDWRAPISSIYYDGKLGKVTYQTPDGEQAVEVSLKRQFILENGRIVSMFDTQETIGDQMLLTALNQNASTKMQGIVTTIQQEQNQIIRDTKSDLLFVQGAAGSGKTSAILQRIAYLLYRYRKKLTSGQVVMFSPNMLFNDYVSQVLPEMGEQNMVQMTYLQYVARRLPQVQVQNLYQQFEQSQKKVVSNANQLVDDLDFFKFETQYAQHLGQGGVHFRNLYFHKKVLIAREKIAEIYYGFGPQYNLLNRIDATNNALIKIVQRKISTEMRKKWVQNQIQDLSQEELRQLYDFPDQEFKNSNEEMKFLARKIVTQALRPVVKQIRHHGFINFAATYYEFLKQVPQLLSLEQYHISNTEWQNYLAEYARDWENKKISLKNISPYLYLYDLITGHHGDLTMKFVFIDEIQDYTPFQLAYLQYNFPRARYTMLGDLNQAIFTQDNAHSILQEVSHLFDPEKTRVVQLTHSYRSTKQITNFTKHLLTAGEKIVPFERSGKLPNIIVSSASAAMLTAVQTQLQKNHHEHYVTAIITKDLTQAQQLTQQLQAQNVKITLIKSENQRLAAGDLVIPAYLAKGLEFDAVIMWNATAGEFSSNDHQLIYTITSRAMHQLTIIAQQKLDPIIAAIPPELARWE
ncbi:RNA polymerase recycling motor HelD [Bombilactobacillus bombi]|uniref:RNA polymerase recycling motor HelD n=1 Tax=Bombilactobacillus bombi TaxID=1303590 RepID=UPI0015E5A55F|nr:RNA polymerase recycling motor HelD [Bombilactobacillus bombi]MBA1434048.1 ATP-dependent DNA helicase [Bombilactobacillus bombi]